MSAFKEMWAQVDALAEKRRLAMPVWCITDDEENGHELVRAPTAEAAKAAYLEEIGVSASAVPSLVVSRATEEQIRREGGEVMFRYVMLFLAGVPAGWAVTFYQLHDPLSVAGCAVASLLFLTCAVYARPKKMPEQRLEKHLMGLRVVGREGDR